MSTSLASSLQLKRAETWSPESLMHTSSSVRQKHRKVTTVITVQWSCRSLMILFLSSLTFKMVIKVCYIIKYMLHIIKIKRLTLQIIWQLMAWVRIHVTLIIINHHWHGVPTFGSFLSFVFTVTIARAIELKHNATIIAALAFETANFYQKAGLYFWHK